MTFTGKSPYWDGSAIDEYSNRVDSIFLFDDVARPHLRQWRTPGTEQQLLDAGCGTGRTVELLRVTGWDTYGITYQSKEVAEFNKRCPELAGQVVEGDLHALPYEDETFDVVLCWDALEHTLAPLHVLGELRRVTKMGGHLVTFIPGQLWADCPYHILVPTIAQMNHLLYLAKWRLQTIYNASDVQDQCAIYLAEKNTDEPPYDVTVLRIRREAK
jgi:ubiquinone/menaquinone biosynthesis C-methylase UbiE